MKLAIDELLKLRLQTEKIVSTLPSEDLVVQVSDDTSPLKWHLAHTSWFFEEFVLEPFFQPYQRFDPHFRFLFNSYYEAVGDRAARVARGTYSRPTVDQVLNYRSHVDRSLVEISGAIEPKFTDEVARRLTLGHHHEQQHQELMFMDLLAMLAHNPGLPRFTGALPTPPLRGTVRDEWMKVEAGLYSIGHSGEQFAFDNEGPRHEVFLTSYSISNRLVTNEEFAEFHGNGGYENPDLWLSDGWETRKRLNWTAPLYWKRIEDEWFQYSLDGLKKLDPRKPVRHVSYYEADAFARWRGARLPTEAEWEVAARAQSDQERWELWQWTASPYVSYPGFIRALGAFGEYNAKFMCNQMVLRGGCEFTPSGHYRISYRNFYQPEKRWNFSGIRLAKT